MKAYEAFQHAQNPQYENIMRRIEQAILCGGIGIRIEDFKLYPEVIDRLTEDGFDITYYCTRNGAISWSFISWEYAKEGRKGIVQKRKDRWTPVQSRVDSHKE